MKHLPGIDLLMRPHSLCIVQSTESIDFSIHDGDTRTTLFEKQQLKVRQVEILS